MNQLLAESFEFAREIVKSIPLIFLKSESDFFLGGRAKARLFQQRGDPYSEHAWVYSAVNSIAMNIASTPFVFQNKSGPVQDTPWNELFETPNKFMGWGQFIEAIITYWHLRGSCMIVLERDSMFEMPKDMMPLDPTMFEPVLNEAKTDILRWKAVTPRKDIFFELWQVVHIKFFNPNDPFFGLSPLSAARQGILQDTLANRFNTMFFENSGSPGGVVEVPGNLTGPQFERFRSQLRDKHQGVNNSHKMMLLEGGAVFKQSQISQKDMEFLNQKKWNRDEILACFKVPKMEVGVWEDVNFAIAKVQAREFWLKNLIPKMDMISWALWRQLFSTVRNGRTWAEFDTSSVPALQDELESKIDMGFKLWTMGWPANQINTRLALNLPANDWQNTSYIPVNMVQIGEDGTPKPVSPDRNNPAEDNHVPSQTGNSPKEIEPNELIGKLKKYFYNQRVRQLKNISSDKPITIGEQVEIEHMVAQTGLPESQVAQIHHAIKCILLEQLGSNENPTEVKEAVRLTYNRIEQRLPELIDMLDKSTN